MLPHIEKWLRHTPEAMRAMVAVGAPAVPRLVAIVDTRIRPEHLRLLHPLGEAGAPLIRPLRGHRDPRVRDAAELVLPYFGRPGIDALRELGRPEREFCAALEAVLMDSRATEGARCAIADELLQHTEVAGIGYFDLARDAKSPQLASRLLLLQGNRGPGEPGATTALLDALAASDATIRAFAVKKLAAHPDRARIAGYVHWLRDDPDPGVQQALQAFAKVGSGR
jgi:hypothetical protein